MSNSAFKRSPVRRLIKKVIPHPVQILNGLYSAAAGGENRPAFYDIDQVYPSLRILDQNYRVIREEMEGVLEQKDHIPRYHDVSDRERYISGTVNPEKNWKVFMLATVMGPLAANEAKCPKTVQCLKSIPNLFQAFFSILDPGKSIPAHCGPYLGYLRYHLALRVPKSNPPSMRVKDRIHTWEEGKSIVFDDSWEHEVYNNAEDLRVVLIVDFFRPLPLHLHAVNWTVAHLVRHSEESKEYLARVKKYSAGEGTRRH